MSNILISREDWVWMPHPGHFICAFDCRFHLNTRIGGVIVSTVGEYFPDAPLREIMAASRGIMLEGRGDDRVRDYMLKIGYETLGLDRKYETMVFKAKKTAEGCCPWRAADGNDLDFAGYNDAKAAYDGHVEMCLKASTGNYILKP